MRKALTWTTVLSPLFGLAYSDSPFPKRGLAYHNPSDRNEYNIFWSENSSITWYYNWGPYPSSTAPTSSNIQFLPLIHGISDISSTISTIQNIPANRPPHPRLLTFNEPDGSLESGGSDIAPADAAAAYIHSVLPLRPQFQISQPSTTGTGSGLAWLQSFNDSCFALAPAAGCPTDFVAAHFYGDFPALASWLGTLHEFYGSGVDIYLTEFALPQTDAATALRMLNQSLPYLDALDYVAGYAWFGLFRTSEANNWTGPGVALLDEDGGLTELGSLYLGGPERGFAVGTKSSGVKNEAVGRDEDGRALMALVIAVAVAAVLWSSVP